jgi:predicted GIY-YIG superfamily endonuclease
VAVRYRDVHYVYVLRSLKDGNLYTGYTSDLRARIATFVGPTDPGGSA